MWRQNVFNDNICLVFSCFQMASTNYYAGNHCLALYHEWMHCFNKLTCAPKDEVVPELVNVYKSPFYFATRKDGAPILTKKLHCKGVLPQDVIFIAPCHVGGIKGHKKAVSTVTKQMKVKTGVMPTLDAAASELGSRMYDGSIDVIVAAGIAPENARSHKARRAQDGRRICDIFCATENCENTVQFKDGHCQPCHDLLPKKLKAEFCTGVGGRVCGRKIEKVNQCRKCYYHPEAKKMREAKKSAEPKCTIDGCRGNDYRSYRLCKKKSKEAKAKIN